VSFAGAVLLDMAALRDEGVGGGDALGPEESSSSCMGAGGRRFDLNALIGELSSKLRAVGLTGAGAAPLLRCAAALSFFALGGSALVLVWGARDVIGTWL
jgi:hypothetical protein